MNLRYGVAPMDIDAAQFTKIVEATSGAGAALTADEARAIVRIARLAVDADDREDDDEIALVDQLLGHVCALAKITAPDEEALPRDAGERSAQLRAAAAPLQGKPSGALGYAVAYLVTIADMDIAPVEHDFVDEVGDAVGLDRERAEDVAATVAEALTPEA